MITREQFIKIAQSRKDRIKEHWKDYQTFGDERNKAMREYRRRKHKLFLKGKIK